MGGAALTTGGVGTTSTYPVFEECIPEPLETSRYTVRFARAQAELEAVQRLRFEVFNVELGEGLEESYATGRDEDRFDPVCHHLMVVENRTGDVVGTYRIQTNAMAERFEGFYSGDEFHLEDFPREILADAIEVGRASVARAYRTRQVLFLLWRGLAAYLEQNRKRFLFGCCSLTSQDPAEGLRVMEYLRREGHVLAEFSLRPREGWLCEGGSADAAGGEEIKLPQLFRIYLRYGAQVCSAPALDRYFKTIDYMVLLNTDDLDSGTRGMFFTTPPP